MRNTLSQTRQPISGNLTMRLLHDILATFRMKSGCSSSNWHAHHAGSALLVALLCLGFGIWFLFQDLEIDRGIGFLALAVAAFLYWRFLLPTALWRNEVHETLHGTNRDSAASGARDQKKQDRRPQSPLE